MRTRKFTVLAVLLLACDLFAAQCSKAPEPAPAPKASPAMWGDMKPLFSVKELMANMIDPAGDDIFEAVWTDITIKGTVEHQPKTDKEWDKVKTAAVTLAEGIYLLKVPRPFAPAGDVNNSTGPDAPELSPTQITEKVQHDLVLWDAKIEALRNVALEVLDIVKRKDAKALLDAGGDLDSACEGCHIEYWYPNDALSNPRNTQPRVTGR